MSVKEIFEWKNIAVICIALLMTLVTVMTASGTIDSGLDGQPCVNTTWGGNVTENVTMYNKSVTDQGGTENVLEFIVNDSAGNITWLNLTFPSEFELPLNTTLNYTGLNNPVTGLTGENVTIIGQTVHIANGSLDNEIWNSSVGEFPNFLVQINNITFTGSPGMYAINATTDQTPTNKTIWLTVGGEPTVTTNADPDAPFEWQQNGTSLYLNATITDIGSGVMNATVDVSSVNDTNIAILDFSNNFWLNGSLFIYAIDGIHNLQITTYDNASQVNDTVNFTIKVDNTYPIVDPVNTFEETPKTWVKNGTTLNLNTTISDGDGSGILNATVLCTPINSTLTSIDLIYDGTNWINNTGAIVNTDAQGRVNLTITTYDNANNMDNSVNFSVYVDNMDPGVNVLNYTEEQNVWVNNGTLLDLNVSVFESQMYESGINASAIFVDISEVNGTQTAILEYAGVNGSNSDQTYWMNNSILVDTATQGRVNLTVTATDNATNVNDTVNFTMWVDNVAPSVTPHSVVYPVDMMFSIQQTAVKYDDVLTLNLTATDLGGSGIDVSDVSVNVTSINDSGDGWSDMYLSDGVWTTTVIVNNSDYTGTVYLDIEVYDNATNVNDTQSFEVELINTVPMFNGSLPITAMMWDGNETEIPTGLYFYYDDSFYDSPEDNPNDNITIQVNMTEHDLIVKANFSQVDGNDTWVEAVSNGNLYNITYQYGNFSDGTSSEQGRGVVIWAFNGAGYMNVSDDNETGFNGPLPFEAIVNVAPDDIYDALLDGMATSDWSLDIDDFTNTTELTFENMSFGKIVFTESINLCDESILDALENFGNMMQFADAELSLNTSVDALSAMNKSANLTMYNLDYFTSSDPGIMMDGVPIVMSGQSSGGTINNVDWNSSGGFLSFSVDHWTSYTADGEEPLVTAISPTYVQMQWLTNGSILDLNASITDIDGSGMKNATVDVSSVNATGIAELDNIAGTYWINDSLIVATSTEGIINLTITAYDNVSNVNNTVNMTVYVDVTAPVLTNLNASYPTGQDSAKRGDSVILNLTAIDPDSYSGLNTSSVQVDLSLINDTLGWTNFTLDSGDDWTYKVVVNASTTGTIELPVHASDNATNINGTEIIYVELDNTPPAVPTITVPVDGSFLSTSSIWVNGTTDADASKVSIYVNGTFWNDSAVSDQEFNVSNVPLGGDGDYTINVSARDAVGNINATNDSVTVTIDTTDPVITMITPNATSPVYKQGGASLYVNFTYTELNANNYTVTISNGSATINTSTIESVGAQGSVLFNLNTTAADGYYNVTVMMWDNASNSNSSTELNAIVLDNTNPTVSLVSVINETEYNSETVTLSTAKNGASVTLNITVDDVLSDINTSAVFVNVSQLNSTLTTWEQFTKIGDNWTYTVIVNNNTEGTFSLSLPLSVSDNAGNENTSESIAVTLSNTQPKVIVVSPDGSQWYKNSDLINLNTSVNSTAGSILSVTVDVSNISSTNEAVLQNISSTNYWYNNSLTVSGAADGTHNLTITAMDDSYNINNSVNMTLKVDNNAPVLTNLLAVYTGGLSAANDGSIVTLNFTAIDSASGVNASAVWVNVSQVNDTSGWQVCTNAGNNNWTYPVIINSSSTGSFYLPVMVYDNVSNVNSSQNITVVLDNSAPSVSPISPIGDTWIKNGTTLNLNATITDVGDAGMLNATVDVSNVNATFTDAVLFNVSDYWSNITLIVATSNEDTIQLTITAYDNVGNFNNTVNLTVKIDNTAPVLTNLNASYPTGQDRAKRGDPVILNLTAVDEGGLSGLNTSSVQVNLSLINDTLGWTNFDSAGGDDWTYTVLVNNSSTDTIKLPVRASDNATNINDTETISVELDNTPPDVPTITVPVDGSFLSTSSIWVNGTTTDSDASNVTIYVNGILTNESAPVGSQMFNVSNVPLGDDDEYIINVSARDAVDNINATNASVTMTLDTTVPLINITSPTTVSYNKGGALMYVNFTYIESNAKNYTVTISNATATINTTTSESVSTGTISELFYLNSTAADGYYNTTVTMWDNASLSNTLTVVGLVVLDNTPPTAPSGLTPASGSYDDDSVSLSWTAASDDLSPTLNYSIYLNNVYNGSTTSTSYSISGLTEGNHTFNVSAADVAGNVNATNDSTIITVDTIDPVISNLSLSTTSPSTYGASITVTVNVLDERSGMSAVSAAGVSLTHQSGDMWNGTISAGYGTNTVTVIATDNASNSVTNTSLIYTGPTAPSTDDDGGRPNLPAPLPNVITTEGKGATLSEPAVSVTLDFAKGEVMSIVVDAKDVMDSIYITVQKLEGKPADVAVSAPGNVHSYININVGKVSGEIAGANIAFKVEKKWLSQNNIAKDNVMLARFSEGAWQQLETTVLNGDDDFVHFSARTPGFSTFAIVAKDVAVTEPVDEIEAPVSVEETAPEVVTETPAPVEDEDTGLPGFEAIFAVMGLLLVTLLVRKQEKN